MNNKKNMKNNLIKYFNQIMQLSEEEENAISESMLVKHFSKETIIQKAMPKLIINNLQMLKKL